MIVGLRIHDDGRTRTADVPGDYRTRDFLEVVVRALRPDSDVSEWTLGVSPEGAQLQLDLTLEENEIRTDQDLFLLRRPTRVTSVEGAVPEGGIRSDQTPLVTAPSNLEADIDRDSESPKAEVENQIEEDPIDQQAQSGPDLQGASAANGEVTGRSTVAHSSDIAPIVSSGGPDTPRDELSIDSTKTSAENDVSIGDGLREKHGGRREVIAKWITERRVPIGVALIGMLLCIGLIWMLWPPKPTRARIRVNLVPPTIKSLHPSSMAAGKGPFTLTVVGDGFVSGAKVKWEGTPLNSTYIDATTLKAEIPAFLIAKAGTASITVRTPEGTSAGVRFVTVTTPTQNHHQ
jgi:hypothetical protein